MPSVFTLGKEPFALGKGFADVALGKVRSAKFFSAKGLCRVLFIGTLGKIKKNCRVLGAALSKIFSAIAAPAVNGYFTECPTQHSANFFLKITLPTAPAQALGKVFFYFFKKVLCRVPLPRHSAKFFFIFFKKVLCRVLLPRHSAKFFFYYFFLKNYFAECPCPGTRQSFFKIISLPSAPV